MPRADGLEACGWVLNMQAALSAPNGGYRIRSQLERSFMVSTNEPETQKPSAITGAAPINRESFSSIWLPERYITRNRNWLARLESLYAIDFKTTSVKSRR